MRKLYFGIAGERNIMILNEEGSSLYFAKIEKVYRKMCAESVSEYDFTPSEIVVLMFLANHTGMNTSKDIAHYRNISKGLVARAVDSLCRKGYLYVEKDTGDRRLGHLYLSGESTEIVQRLQECKKVFWRKMQKGIPEEQMEIFRDTINKMYNNVIDISEL